MESITFRSLITVKVKDAPKLILVGMYLGKSYLVRRDHERRRRCVSSGTSPRAGSPAMGPMETYRAMKCHTGGKPGWTDSGQANA